MPLQCLPAASATKDSHHLLCCMLLFAAVCRLQAEVMELKAPVDVPATAVVVEAQVRPVV
jgi:hypothetical protein